MKRKSGEELAERTDAPAGEVDARGASPATEFAAEPTVDAAVARAPLVGGSLPRWGPWAVFAGVTAAMAGVLALVGFNVA
nr:hypothetical protein [Actinomycetota bacterium]